MPNSKPMSISSSSESIIFSGNHSVASASNKKTAENKENEDLTLAQSAKSEKKLEQKRQALKRKKIEEAEEEQALARSKATKKHRPDRPTRSIDSGNSGMAQAATLAGHNDYGIVTKILFHWFRFVLGASWALSIGLYLALSNYKKIDAKDKYDPNNEVDRNTKKIYAYKWNKKKTEFVIDYSKELKPQLKTSILGKKYYTFEDQIDENLKVPGWTNEALIMVNSYEPPPRIIEGLAISLYDLILHVTGAKLGSTDPMYEAAVRKYSGVEQDIKSKTKDDDGKEGRNIMDQARNNAAVKAPRAST